MKILHLFFTPFCIGVEDELVSLYRLEILKNITIPSMASQTSKNFTWYILFDENCSELIKSNLIRTTESFEMITLVAVSKYSDRIQKSVEITKYRIASEEPSIIIQSRIDDDDAMHIEAIENIQNQAVELIKHHEITAIGLDSGYDYLCEEKAIKPIHENSLSIGLSLAFQPHINTAGIFSISHMTVIDHFKKVNGANGSTSIKLSPGSYLYTRHPFCDNSYFAMLARFKKSSEKKELKDKDPFWSTFGLSPENIEYLEKITKSSPIGYPGKFITEIERIEDKVRTEIDDLVRLQSKVKKKHILQSLTRKRIDKKTAISILTLGISSRQVAAKVSNSLPTNPIIHYASFNDLITIVSNGQYFDVCIFDPIEIFSSGLEHSITISNLKKYITLIEKITDYSILIEWEREWIENYKSLIADAKKISWKVQPIGGESINPDKDIEEENKRIINAMANQLLLNI
ncbi:glycosyltransferase [Chromobacterium sp. IIBBL 290-4]|uniref:glycosyltransferase n=1 Tax=Chromobacterium sp. IIBBL 290-4 TaxID=2953890 RepID=UPI0020B8576D|nr:glycosyltransferase [Chromobacterium sp. IIBBL 290-4]UTH76249.1 putative rhamnosyl transferase [Chromobacterium sp. IIBBL 290-4]